MAVVQLSGGGTHTAVLASHAGIVSCTHTDPIEMLTEIRLDGPKGRHVSFMRRLQAAYLASSQVDLLRIVRHYG